MKNGFLRFSCVIAVCLVATQASAAILIYDAILSDFESPPSGSLGTGSAEVDIDDIANTMRVRVTFSGLTSGTTASHIHCCTGLAETGTAIVATTNPSFPGFPVGVTSGTYDSGLLDTNEALTYNPAFVLAKGGTVDSALQALLAGLNADEAYLNIHTVNFPAGEIHGFLHAVPEPGTWALMIPGFCGLAFMAYRRKRANALAPA